MKNIYSLTIAIAAHNEEQNIGKLLESIAMQKAPNYIVKKIVVYCDNCSDNTVGVIKRYQKKVKQLTYVDDGKRFGKAGRMNMAFSQNKSDVLITLDADVILATPHVLSSVVTCFQKNKTIELVGGNDIPQSPRNIFESLVVSWIQYWQYSHRPINQYCNPTNNPGRMYSLRKSLAKQMRIDTAVAAEDHFVFYRTMQLKKKFMFCEEAKVLFKAPNNLNDFLHQSDRFGKSGKTVKDYFSFSFKKYQYLSPTQKYLSFITYFFRDPIRFPFALLLQVYVKIYSALDKEQYKQGVYTTINSSK